MKRLVVPLVALCLLGGPAMALTMNGTNEGGVLLLLHHPTTVYTVDPYDYCLDGYDLCDQPCDITQEYGMQDYGGAGTVKYVLAYFPPGVPVAVAGAQFGIMGYDPYCVLIGNAGPCIGPSGLEIPGDGWPGPDTGTSLTFGPVVYNQCFPVYWLYTYSYCPYYCSGTMMCLGPNPDSGQGQFGDDSAPPVLQDITGYGCYGFCMPGYVPCYFGACCIGFDCYQFTEDWCMYMGGTFMGIDVPCDPGLCGGAPEGACCVGPDCYIMTYDDCMQMGGDYLGDDTVCDPNPCPGACCDCDICIFITFDECVAGGYAPGWQGNIWCDPNPCADYPPSATETTTWGSVKASYR
jgi:hypothetical protein